METVAVPGACELRHCLGLNLQASFAKSFVSTRDEVSAMKTREMGKNSYLHPRIVVRCASSRDTMRHNMT